MELTIGAVILLVGILIGRFLLAGAARGGAPWRRSNPCVGAGMRLRSTRREAGVTHS